MSDNEYANMKAAACAARPGEIKATVNSLSIAIYLSSRKCLYEIGNEYADGIWSLVDRWRFPLMRWHMGRWMMYHLRSSESTLLYYQTHVDNNKTYVEDGN